MTEGEAVVEASRDPRYVEVTAGTARRETDEFKRYVVHDITFDTRADILDEIGSDWAPEVVDQWVRNRECAAPGRVGGCPGAWQ